MVWGHWFLGFIHDTIHRGIFERFWVWAWWKLNRADLTSKQHYLEVNYRIPRHASLNAYHAVRDACLDEKPRGILHRQHSEAYALYITAFWAILAAIILQTCAKDKATLDQLRFGRDIIHGWLCGLALVTLVAGVLYDILISKAECLYLKILSETKYKEVCAVLRPLRLAWREETKCDRFIRHVSVPIGWAICLPVLVLLVQWSFDSNWLHSDPFWLWVWLGGAALVGFIVPLIANCCSGQETSATTPCGGPDSGGLL
jgi:hypothetical protein